MRYTFFCTPRFKLSTSASAEDASCLQPWGCFNSAGRLHRNPVVPVWPPLLDPAAYMAQRRLAGTIMGFRPPLPYNAPEKRLELATTASEVVQIPI